VVSYLGGVYRVSVRRACRVVRIANSTFRYRSRRQPQVALRLRIREIAQVRVRYGYRKIRVLLNREGWNVGKKLVCRLYREEDNAYVESFNGTVPGGVPGRALVRDTGRSQGSDRGVAAGLQ